MSSGTPPVGLDLTANQAPRYNATVGAVLALATVFVGLRVWARVSSHMGSAGLGIDDWMVILALTFAYGTGICCFLAGAHGVGKHIWVVTEADVLVNMKIMFAFVYLYTYTVVLVKLSVLLLYYRIFALGWKHYSTLKLTLYFCAFLCIGYAISCTVTITVACRPISFFWNQWVDPLAEGRCVIDLYAFYLGNGIASMLTDFIILTVPMPIVWQLQMRRTEKLTICGIFLLGGFVCVAGIVRIYNLTKMKDAVDFTWAFGDPMVWSNVEPCIGIVSACLPTLRPLARKVSGPLFGRIWSSRGHHGSSPKGISGNRNGGSDQRGDANAALANRNANRGDFPRLSANCKKAFRQDDDEVYLRTDISAVENQQMQHGVGKHSNSSKGSIRGSLAMGVMVRSDVRWSVSED